MNTRPDKHIADLPTPALLLDLDRLESNIETMQSRAASLGVRLRPHIKTHKCLEVGELQRAAGAAGITVSTLEEAAAFADAGFNDILWAFPLILSRVDEVVALSERTTFGVTVDSQEAIDALVDAGAPLDVWLEIDVGYGRSGVAHDDERVVRLAERIVGSSSLSLRGCLTHAGHTYDGATPEAIAETAEAERAAMVEVGERLRAAGIEPGTLSLGSTPGMSLVRDLRGIDEARPGNYALYDGIQVELGACTVEHCAATVLGSVVSSKGNGRSVTDCGALVMSKDVGSFEPKHYGQVFADLDGEALGPHVLTSVSQEHASIDATLPVGTKVRILPNHSCLTVARFDHFHVVRQGKVIDTWKIWRSRGPLGAS